MHAMRFFLTLIPTIHHIKYTSFGPGHLSMKQFYVFVEFLLLFIGAAPSLLLHNIHNMYECSYKVFKINFDSKQSVKTINFICRISSFVNLFYSSPNDYIFVL